MPENIAQERAQAAARRSSTPTRSPRPQPRPSMGERIMSGIRSAGAQIRSDFQHATGSNPYTGDALKSYNDRTAASRAAHEQALATMRQNDRGSSPATQTAVQAPSQEDQYAENKRRYEEYMKSQQPQPTEITPDMRQAALQTFESQRGAGQMPYYMAAAAQSQDPNMSPAFQYAAQNYATLGGSQRLGPRPMEMMSVAERRQINDMAQAMADQQAQQQAAKNEYQAGMDMVLRGGGKGGPRTGPQIPDYMLDDFGSRPQRPAMPAQAPQRFGGKGGAGGDPRTAQLGAMLASRFGRMY